jgi:membrane protease YdiL (CAAX protease family)
MELGILDHVLAAILTAVLPVYAIWEFRDIMAKVKSGDPIARLRGYVLTIVVEWGLVAAIFAVWILGGRTFSSLGFGIETGLRFWTGAGLALLGIAFFIVQTRSAISSPENLNTVRGQFGNLRYMLPSDKREWNLFKAVSVTAGICEEIMYRGFFMIYLQSLTGTWAAVIVSSIIFGLGHAYQGPMGIVKTGIAGLIMAGLYVLTGSLWVPIVLHAAIDLVNGYLGYRAMKDGAAE